MSDRDRNLQTQETLGGVLGERNPDRLGEGFADDVVDRDPAPGQAAGLAGIQDFWREFFTAFPDLEAQPVHVSADDDTVTAVLEITGTNTGPFQGHEPTGKRIKIRGIQVGRFENGKIVERWGASDEAGILKQLGLA